MRCIPLLTTCVAIVLVSPVWAETTTIVVHPQQGNDQTGDGSPEQPLRSITHALRRVRGKTIIQLAQGTYTEEQFPLVLSRETIVQGDIGGKGAGILIRGGGRRGLQHVTIVLKDQAQLRGVTVTNEQTRGFGVWIEGGNPTVINNTFTQNQQSAIGISGRSTPLIQDNLIQHNLANGITIEQLAVPEIRGNTITNNPVGISIRHNSTPQILQNLISHNQDGIIIQEQARPLLRHNQIVDQQRTGVVVLGSAMPDLGTINSLGQNIFRNNPAGDIYNSSIYAVAAHGNQLEQAKLIGKIHLQVEQLTTPKPLPSSQHPSIVVSLTGQPLPVDPHISPHLPPIRPTPPQGDAVNQPIVISPPRPLSVITQPPRWRVIVPVLNPDTLHQLRTLFPSAFASNRGGRSVIQIGAYSDRRIALERIQQLSQLGLPAELENIQ